jgi:hypothetical protein
LKKAAAGKPLPRLRTPRGPALRFCAWVIFAAITLAKLVWGIAT